MPALRFRIHRTIAIATLAIPFVVSPGCDQAEERAQTATPAAPAVAATPETTVDPGPVLATVRTRKGDFTMELRPDVAPRACASFVNLVRRGFYDGLEFYRHSRVIRQAGNPWNDEERRWNCGYAFMPEFSPDLRFDRAGMVGLVRIADDVRAPVRANEFFVTTKPQSERFTFTYPIFAVIVEGQDVVDALEEGERIDTIKLSGNHRSILDPLAEEVATWNRALDAADDPRRSGG